MLFSNTKSIFGLDISDQALRLVNLKTRGKKNTLGAFAEITIPAGIINQGEIQDEKKIISSLKELAKKISLNPKNKNNIVAVLPESKTFIKVIEVTLEEEKELAELVTNEAKNHIPLDLNELYLDWQILEKNKQQATVLVGAAPKKIVDSYVKILEQAGLEPIVFEIEAAAIIRSLLTEADAKARLIIDFGAARTGLALYDKGTVQFTISLPVSGNKTTATIAQTLNLDLVKAEKAKIICGLDKDKCEGALLKILMDSIDELTNHINQAIAFYQSGSTGGNKISEVVLCGGGANFSEINTVLAEKLNLPVRIGTPTKKIKQPKKKTIPKNKNLSYTTAIGLALRPFQKKQNGIILNLLPPPKKQAIKTRETYALIKNVIIIILLYTIAVAISLLVTKLALQNHFNRIVGETTLTTRYGDLFNQDIKLFNQRIKEVEKIQQGYISWSSLMSDFTRLIPPGISITSITVQAETPSESSVIINGQAITRDQVLLFQNNLEQSMLFSEVNIPLEHLLQRENINFAIQLRANLDHLGAP